MARKRAETLPASLPTQSEGSERKAQTPQSETSLRQRPAAEDLFRDDLIKLAEHDADLPRPLGWLLTPRSIVSFILGDTALGISPKFVGKHSLVERCVVALATNRGLMLIGEPGTAKSWLSELLAAAISGDSTLTIQGSAGTTEDAIKYSWNYALLLAEGPSERSMVPAPLYRGMQQGKIVRFEELTRCPLEMQDVMLSILSDRVMAVPELPDDARTLYAKTGFNVIATANTRDRGVNEMSAALKRRFNFETVFPIENIQEEMALVQRETDKLLQRAGVPITLPQDLTAVLVTAFHELRTSKDEEGKALEPLTTPMSTAEAISAGYAAGLHAWYYSGKAATPQHLVQHIAGSALKDAPDDLKKLKHYFNTVVKAKKGELWKELYSARSELP